MKSILVFILLIISLQVYGQDISEFRSGFITDSIPFVYNIDYFANNNKKWNNTFDHTDITKICQTNEIECTHSDKGWSGFPIKLHIIGFNLFENIVAFTYMSSIDNFEKKIYISIYDFNNNKLISKIEIYKNICQRIYSESEIDPSGNAIINRYYQLNMGHEIYYVESKYSVGVTGEIQLVSRIEKGIDDDRIRNILKDKTCFPYIPKDDTKFIKQ